ncbi:hypothetical protein K491DRAFT_694085 [Lophiostoma macrostomum CBS 122681]|uniref:Uncharacterized protein n=1 Tax=Lophiostoma macrostomum CBS 122681 TaxID=1314788 RepID=A0A6A6T5E7_9PLEO|nr:hypothetical protein K491DRAFT_694085 [Lophiostoma macrostomum CBS 122681]
MRSTSLFICALGSAVTLCDAVANNVHERDSFLSTDADSTSTNSNQDSTPEITALATPTHPEPEPQQGANTTSLGLMSTSAYQMWSPDGNYTLALHLNDKMELDIPIPGVVWTNFCHNVSSTSSTGGISTTLCPSSIHTITITERPSTLSAASGVTAASLPTASSNQSSLLSPTNSRLHSSTSEVFSTPHSSKSPSVNSTVAVTSISIGDSGSAIPSNATTRSKSPTLPETTTGEETLSSTMSKHHGNRTKTTLNVTSETTTTPISEPSLTHVDSSTPASSEPSIPSSKGNTTSPSSTAEFDDSATPDPELEARSPHPMDRPLPFLVAAEATCTQHHVPHETFQCEGLPRRTPTAKNMGHSAGNWSGTIPHVLQTTSSLLSSMRVANLGVPRRLRTVDWWFWNRARVVPATRPVADPTHLLTSASSPVINSQNKAGAGGVQMPTAVMITTYTTTSAAATHLGSVNHRPRGAEADNDNYNDDTNPDSPAPPAQTQAQDSHGGPTLSELPTDLYSFFSTIPGHNPGTQSTSTTPLTYSTRTEPHGAPASSSSSSLSSNPTHNAPSTSLTQYSSLSATTAGPTTSQSESSSLPPLIVDPQGNGAVKNITVRFDWVMNAGWGLVGAMSINGMWQFQRMVRGEVEFGKCVGHVWMWVARRTGWEGAGGG